MSVVIETTLGDVTVDLFTAERPQTCLNFLKLCKIKYYNLCLFHSVSSNFLAQTGDPTGKGDGGESIFGVIKGKQHKLYQGEKLPRIKHDRPGLLSMVSHGDGMLGSQFVITLSGNLTSLDQEHCVFGQIVEGEELLLKLNEAIADDQHRPYQDIRITHTVILEDPFPDPEGLEVPPLSPVPPNPKDVAYSRIPADEPLTENYTQEELDEMVQQREAAARAAILEMVGDIPDAEAAPPENVLFVCKLNPVTTDHDLSIIFSRFGKVKSCEVIRDQISGDSLQYAFVEFEDRKACEDAYFKMDNVLIDDRRIHVDFSQSVAKLKWKGKGKGVEILGPPPPGGWGNRSRDNKRKPDDNVKSYNDGARKKGKNFNEERRANCEANPVRNGKGLKDNEKQYNNRRARIENKKEGKKREKPRRRKSSSSSSSSSESSTESSSSSESSESSYHKKKSRSNSRKVLVVVKTPRRSKTHKKPRKIRNKSKRYKTDSDSESESDPGKKKKKKTRRKSSSSEESSSEESSSDETDEKRKRKRKRSTSSEDEPKTKKKKKKPKERETSETSSEDDKKKNKRKRKANSSSDSEIDKGKKRKKVKSKKKKTVKKNKKKHKHESDTTSSSD